VVLRKFKTDRTIPSHTHPDANKWAYVLSGDGEESDVTYDRRYAVPSAQRQPPGPHMARTEVASLNTFDGPPTVV